MHAYHKSTLNRIACTWCQVNTMIDDIIRKKSQELNLQEVKRIRPNYGFGEWFVK